MTVFWGQAIGKKMIRPLLLLTVPAAVLLASCASLPPMEIEDTGSLPPPAGFQLRHDETGASSAFAAAIATELEARGFTDTERPDYLVQIAGSDLPGKTGLFVPDAPTGEDDQQQWLSSPTRTSSIRTRRLVISVTEIASGREVYRVHGIAPYRSGQADHVDRLANAILAQLSPQ
jgi:hypothetical protein